MVYIYIYIYVYQEAALGILVSGCCEVLSGDCLRCPVLSFGMQGLQRGFKGTSKGVKGTSKGL